jgi:hypothetical protein
MFPLPISAYIYAGLILLSIICFGYGRHEHNRYVEFKSAVEIAQKQQEAHVESITKQQTLVTKGIKDEYDAKIAAIRNYYKSTSVWNNGSTSKVSGLSPAPSIADVIASYNQLTSSCAETTQQLISLQDWINQQIGIK